MPTMHAAFPSLFVKNLFLMRDIVAANVFKIYFFLAHYQLRQLKTMLFYHFHQPLLIGKLLFASNDLLKVSQSVQICSVFL
jgi:hypothetical protein